MVELLLWTLACWTVLFAACAFFRDSLGARWRRVALLAGIPAFLAALVLVFVSPPIGGYNPMAARFWMGRAAAETDIAAKEDYVRRVAFASPEHGWFVASQAIESVEDRLQRCRLRTILAGLAGVRNKLRLGNEAREECNASLTRAP
jgi:hypothetical protein